MITPDQGAPYLDNVVSILRHERQLQHGGGELLHRFSHLANRFVVDAMVGTFGISLWISSLEDSKSRIGQARGYRSQGVCQVSVF